MLRGASRALGPDGIIMKPGDALDVFEFEPAAKKAVLSQDAGNDKNLPTSASIADLKIRSVMCVPLATQDGKPLGVIQLDSQDRTKKFSQEDLKFLVCVANSAAVAIENARMHETILQQQKLEEENRAASKVQRGFLPQLFPLVPGYEFFGFGLPEAAEGLAALKEKRSPQFRAMESRLLAGTQAGRPAGRHAPAGGPLRGPAEHGWRTRLAGPRVRQPQDRVRDISYR